MLLKEFEGATKFKEDFFKVVEFLHYLEDEGYDMKTFERVKRNLWIFNTLEKNFSDSISATPHPLYSHSFAKVSDVLHPLRG